MHQCTRNRRESQRRRERLTKGLASGDPPIALGRVRGTGEKGLLVSVFMLQDGEERIVAGRLREVLKRAAG